MNQHIGTLANQHIKRVLFCRSIPSDQQNNEAAQLQQPEDISHLLPFIPRNADRFMMDGAWMMGNRRQYDVHEPEKVICIGEKEPRIADEIKLFETPLQDCGVKLKPGTVLLFEVEKSDKIIDLMGEKLPLTSFIGDITHLPAAAWLGQGDYFRPLDNRIFKIRHRYFMDGAVLIFAMDATNEMALMQSDVHADKLRMIFFEFTPPAGLSPMKMQRKPDITHLLPIAPGFGDYFRPYADANTVYHGEPVMYDYHNPNLIIAVGQRQRVQHTLSKPMSKVEGG